MVHPISKCVVSLATQPLSSKYSHVLTDYNFIHYTITTQRNVAYKKY
jgi:hypothetical protein